MAIGTPRWIQDGELRDYDSQPDGRPDIGNRPHRDVFDNLTVQHDYSTGAHATGGCLVIEADQTYTGNGGDNRNISLSNANLDILFLMIWRDDTEYPVLYSTDMTSDNTKELETSAFQADMIQSVGTGTFQVGTDPAVNENLIVYKYFAVGTL